MSKLIPIKRDGEGWAEYCRIAGLAFKASLDSDDPWDPNKQPHEDGIEHFLYKNEEGDFVGLLSVRHTDHDFVYVNNVAIDPARHRHGYGLKMMHDFEQAVSKKYDGAWLQCAFKNMPFYSRSGYETTPDQVTCPGYISMAKRFRPKVS